MRGRHDPEIVANSAGIIRRFLPEITDDTILRHSAETANISHPDAMALMFLASNGFESRLDTPAGLGMTKKRYYVRLQGMEDAGQVSKNKDGRYRLTSKGTAKLARLTEELQETADKGL